MSLNLSFTDVYENEDSASSTNDGSSSLLAEVWTKAGHCIDQVSSSALYAGAQSPLIGASQLLDRTIGSDLEKHCHFMEAPTPAAAFRSADWHLQQIGNAAGVVVPFLVVNKLAGPMLDRVVGKGQTIGQMMSRAAITGAVYDFTLRPSEDPNRFWEERARNATAGAVAFGTLSGASGVFQKTNLLGNGLTNKVLSGFAAGLPAGALGTTVELGWNGDLRRDWDKSLARIGEGAYGFAFVGGFMGAAHTVEGKLEKWKESRQAEREGLLERAANPNAPREFKILNGHEALERFRENNSLAASLTVREVFSNGKEGPKRTLVVQHDSPTAPEAAKADILAFCNPEAAQPGFAKRHVLPGTEGSTWMAVDQSTGQLRFSAGELAPEAGAMKLSNRIRALLSKREFNLGEMPPEILKLKPSGERWRGNDCTVFGLEPVESRPDAVLKVARGCWEADWGRRPFDAKVIDIPGRSEKFFESESGNDYLYLQERVETDPSDTSGYLEFLAQIESLGYELADQGGYGKKQIGKNADGRWVVIDYDAVRKKGSGTHDVENSGNNGDFWDEKADRDSRDSRDHQLEALELVDPDSLASRAEAIDGLELTDSEASRATALGLKAQDIRELLRQMTDGLNSPDDILMMQTIIAGGHKAAVAQLNLIKRIARSRRIVIDERPEDQY